MSLQSLHSSSVDNDPVDLSGLHESVVDSDEDDDDNNNLADSMDVRRMPDGTF